MAKIKYGGLGDLVFFTPVSGMVTTSFNLSEDHYGYRCLLKKRGTMFVDTDEVIVVLHLHDVSVLG